MRELAIVADGAILVANGKIERTGTTDEIGATIARDNHLPVIDARGCAVTPGFVDAHTHAIFAGSRAAEFEQRIAGKTYQQIAEAGGGIANTVSATRAATAVEILALAGRHAEWFLRGGTTTIESKSGYGLSLDAEL
jgi:imidazolonepropionase